MKVDMMKLNAERWPLLSVASLVILAEDISKDFRNAVDAQFPADGQRS